MAREMVSGSVGPGTIRSYRHGYAIAIIFIRLSISPGCANRRPRVERAGILCAGACQPAPFNLSFPDAFWG